MNSNAIKPIAIHLPQFHPFAENDKWWGKGFTEWTNVTKAKPLFPGHYQPHLPSDLGFYDLRLHEARVAQAELAKQYGIYGFCYYHYWFNGKRLMEQPLDGILRTGQPEFPFMLCWANENWTRRWDGMDQEVLIHQDYSEKDDLDHIRFLCGHFFADPRYIRVDGKPFFIVYRPELNPDIAKTLQIWRNEAVRLGMGELYIGYMHFSQASFSLSGKGFDCGVQFHPDFSNMPNRLYENAFMRALHTFNIRTSQHLQHKIFDYRDYVEKVIRQKNVTPGIYPGITPMWDNTARRKKGANILINSSPDAYKKWLTHIVKEYQDVSAENKFVFINAWNEWAEGNHLEPCQKWGRSYLEATRDAIAHA